MYNTYISSIQSIVSSDSTTVNVSRSLTSLRSVFISSDTDVQEGRLNLYNTSRNNVYSPMAGKRAIADIVKNSAT